MLRTVQAVRYVLPLREGGSVPALVEADDLGFYVVKLRGASQGARALIAELVAGELARALALPVPELVLVELDRALAASEPDPEICEPLERSAGVNRLDYLPGSITFDRVSDPKPDATRASRIVLLDAFVANVDRTPRNPNLLLWHEQAWLIDHGTALYFHHGWTAKERLDGSSDSFGELKDHVLLPYATAMSEAACHLRRVFTTALMARIVAAIPDGWLLAEDAFATASSARDAYVAWLTARLDAIPALLAEAERARALRV